MTPRMTTLRLVSLSLTVFALSRPSPAQQTNFVGKLTMDDATQVDMQFGKIQQGQSLLALGFTPGINGFNYAVSGTGTYTIFNAPPGGSIFFSVGSTSVMLMNERGELAVGHFILPTAAIDVNGPIVVREVIPPGPGPQANGKAALWADAGDLWGRGTVSGAVNLTGGVEGPGGGELMLPDAESSFSDPQVPLPWVHEHRNDLIGKGEIVDMAMLVKLVEELSGRSLTRVYDLPQRLDPGVYLADRREAEVHRIKTRALMNLKEIEVPIAEAWIEVDETRRVPAEIPRTRFEYDLDSGTVTQATVMVAGFIDEPTGGTARRLRDDVRFDAAAGKFYRRLTLDDFDALIRENPPQVGIPDWILDRIPPADEPEGPGKENF